MKIPWMIEALLGFVLSIGFILFPFFFWNFIHQLFRKTHTYEEKEQQNSQLRLAISLFLFSMLCLIVLAGMSYFYGDKETWFSYKAMILYYGTSIFLAFIVSLFIIRWKKIKRFPQKSEQTQ